MDPQVAQAVLDQASRVGAKIGTAEGSLVIRAWFKARGISPDPYGNYKLKNDERFHLSKQMLQKQLKHSRGDWGNIASTPIIDAAQNLIIAAAQALGREDILERAQATKTKRKQAVDVRAQRAAEERVRKQAFVLANKRLAKEYPAKMMQALMRQASEETVTELANLRSQWTEEAFERLKAGQQPPDDSTFASADQPPVLPIFAPDHQYVWDETVDGVEYTVFVERSDAGGNTALVVIGHMGSMGMFIHPIQHGIDFAHLPADAKGDGQLSGTVQFKNGKMFGHVFSVGANEKRRGAGSRIMALWCRLMKGYGATMWLAEAIGDEGEAFIKAMVAKGKVRVLGVRDHNAVLECV
jgi:hypothetical protein